MKDVKTILSKDKLNRTELSQIYKSIKAQQLNIPWIDLLRKTTRGEVISKLKNKLDPPKPTIKKSNKETIPIGLHDSGIFKFNPLAISVIPEFQKAGITHKKAEKEGVVGRT